MYNVYPLQTINRTSINLCHTQMCNIYLKLLVFDTKNVYGLVN